VKNSGLWNPNRVISTGDVSRGSARWTSRTTVAVSVAAVTALTLAACGGKSSSSSPSSSKPGVVKSVTYATTNVSHVYDPEILIQSDPSICAQFGVKPDIQTLSQAAALPALIAGQIQMTHIATGSVLQGALQDAASTKIVAGTGALPFVLWASKDIKSMADLKGQTVGASTPGSGGDLGTRIALEEAGLTVGTAPDDVKMAYTGNSAALVGLGASGAIKAFIFLAPLPAAAVTQGVHELKNLTGDPKIDPISELTVSANSAFLKNNPDTVKGMLACLAFAQKEVLQGTPAAVAAVAKALNIAPADAAYALLLNNSSYTMFPFTVDKAKIAIAALQKYNVTQFGNFDPAPLIDNSLVPRARPNDRVSPGPGRTRLRVTVTRT
jgi:ABC-type nitrate/sulfonate/bicarbonate transport system substrate-binding protein